MDFLVGILLLLCGIFTLVKGELKLSKSAIARGRRARLAGVLMVLALPISMVVSMLTPTVMAIAGHPVNIEDPSDGERLLPMFVMLIVAFLAFVVALRRSSAPPKP